MNKGQNICVCECLCVCQNEVILKSYLSKIVKVIVNFFYLSRKRN